MKSCRGGILENNSMKANGLGCSGQGFACVEQLTIHSKKGWVVSTQIWVKYGQTQMLG